MSAFPTRHGRAHHAAAPRTRYFRTRAARSLRIHFFIARSRTRRCESCRCSRVPGAARRSDTQRSTCHTTRVSPPATPPNLGTTHAYHPQTRALADYGHISLARGSAPKGISLSPAKHANCCCLLLTRAGINQRHDVLRLLQVLLLLECAAHHSAHQYEQSIGDVAS